MRFLAIQQNGFAAVRNRAKVDQDVFFLSLIREARGAAHLATQEHIDVM